MEEAEELLEMSEKKRDQKVECLSLWVGLP